MQQSVLFLPADLLRHEVTCQNGDGAGQVLGLPSSKNTSKLFSLSKQPGIADRGVKFLVQNNEFGKQFFLPHPLPESKISLYLTYCLLQMRRDESRSTNFQKLFKNRFNLGQP
ncbi:hypothetical protein JTE90_028611 [Oedothorax gibbosus]|uniref:Uncharacterized protein n=1 Tax=Oedothorax gibbosus TaxID=931172 RepID=A0AAV6TXS1_9ARAC|nr:hypothetical protein JTE90_028611 [Oedothorax gibbosus]